MLRTSHKSLGIGLVLWYNLNNGMIILKWILEEWDVGAWTGSVWDRWRDVVNAVMNLRAFIKYCEFLE